MGSWLRSSRGFATVGLSLAMLVSSVLVLAGVGSPKSAFDFGSGFSWLNSDENGQAALVNGADGKATVKLNVPGAKGRGMHIEQREGHAYVTVDEDGETKVLYRLDDATLNTAAQARVKKKERVLRSAGKAFLVNEADGTVLPIDPESLQKIGEPLYFKGAIATGMDGAGRLIVVQLDTATASIVEGTSASEPISVGGAGDHLKVSTISGHVLVVDVDKNELTRFDGKQPIKMILPSVPGELLVPDQGEGDDAVLLRKDGTHAQLIVAGLKSGSGTRAVRVQGDVGAVRPPLATKDAVFLVDPSAGEVTTVDPVSGETRTTVDPEIGKGDDLEAFVKDGYLWINNPKGRKAAVIDRHGHKKDVNKYDEKVPVVNPDPADPPPATPDVPPGSPDTPTVIPKPAGNGPTNTEPTAAPATTTPPPPVANAPGKPMDFKGTAGNRSASLTWGTPASGGSPITGYKLLCSPDCGGPSSVDLPPSESTVVDNLVNGKAYSFSIVASNGIGDGPSATVSGITPTGDVPARPSDARAQEKADGTVTVTWAESDEGLAITGFQIVATSNSSALVPATAPKTKSYDVDAKAKSFTTKADDLAYDDDTSPDWAFTVKAIATKDGAPVESQPSDPSNGVDPYRAPAFANATTIVGQSANGVSATVKWGKLEANGRPITKLTILDASKHELATIASPKDSGTSPGFTVEKGKSYAGAQGVLTNEAGDGSPLIFTFATPDVPKFTAFNATGANGQVTATVAVTSAVSVSCQLMVDGNAVKSGGCTTLSAGVSGYGPHDVYVKAINAVSGTAGVDTGHASVGVPAPVNSEYVSGGPALSGFGRKYWNDNSLSQGPWYYPWGGGYRVIDNCPSLNHNGPVSAVWSIGVPQPGKYSLFIQSSGGNATYSANYWVNGSHVGTVDQHPTNGPWIGVGQIGLSQGTIQITSNNDVCEAGGQNAWVNFETVKLRYDGP